MRDFVAEFADLVGSLVDALVGELKAALQEAREARVTAVLWVVLLLGDALLQWPRARSATVSGRR